MKAINIKLASFTFAAMLLASCSDSNDGPGATPTNPDVVGKEVTSITDAQTLAARVNNYKSVKTSSRVAGATSNELQEVYNMPAAPTDEELSKAIETTTAQLAWDADKTKPYIIKKGQEITSAINLSGATLYIAGKLHATGCWGN